MVPRACKRFTAAFRDRRNWVEGPRCNKFRIVIVLPCDAQTPKLHGCEPWNVKGQMIGL
jgi:hypothetical protein